MNEQKTDLKSRYDRLSPEAQKALKWGAIGALVAIPVPFVGPLLGGALGGGLGYARAKGKI